MNERHLLRVSRRGSAAGVAFALVVSVLFACGCASNSAGPEVLTIRAADYAAAFDAACEVARQNGLPATLRDRRGGVIETLPRIAGSILEPWRTDNASLSQSLENTVVYQRRRARFEFLPVGTVEPPDDDDQLIGPDVVNAQSPLLDLTNLNKDLELRVWVYLERANLPGQRRSTWTRSKTTQAALVYPEGMTDRRSVQIVWAPSARDPDYERRLLARVKELLEAPAGGEENSGPLAMSQNPRTIEPNN